ncbi:unnamed protein product, partial [Effrenium voratum]
MRLALLLPAISAVSAFQRTRQTSTVVQEQLDGLIGEQLARRPSEELVWQEFIPLSPAEVEAQEIIPEAPKTGVEEIMPHLEKRAPENKVEEIIPFIPEKAPKREVEEFVPLAAEQALRADAPDDETVKDVSRTASDVYQALGNVSKNQSSNVTEVVGDVGKVVSDLVTPHGSQASQDTTDEGANQTGVVFDVSKTASDVYQALGNVSKNQSSNVTEVVGDVGKVVSDLVTPHGSQDSQDTTDEGANQTGVVFDVSKTASDVYQALGNVSKNQSSNVTEV